MRQAEGEGEVAILLSGPSHAALDLGQRAAAFQQPLVRAVPPVRSIPEFSRLPDIRGI